MCRFLHSDRARWHIHLYLNKNIENIYRFSDQTYVNNVKNMFGVNVHKSMVIITWHFYCSSNLTCFWSRSRNNGCIIKGCRRTYLSHSSAQCSPESTHIYSLQLLRDHPGTCRRSGKARYRRYLENIEFIFI